MHIVKTSLFNTKPSKINTRVLAILILLIVLAALLRLYNLGERSLWYDEAASVGNVMGLLKLSPYEDWGLSGLLSHERVPPLYFFYLIPFYHLSTNEWSMRLSSVIFGILTIPLMYRFGAKLFNQRVGLIGSLLLTFSPLHIYYSQELRSYAMFLFFSILIFYLAYLALENNKISYYIGFIVASVLGVYTYTYTVFPIFIVNLYFIFNWRRYRHLLGKWILFHLLIVVLCLPEIYHTIYFMVRGKTELSDYPVGWRNIFSTFYIFTTGRVLFPSKLNLVFIVLLAAIFGGGLLLGSWALWRERISDKGRRLLSLLMAVAITYIGICFISIILIPLFDEARVNYIIFFLPFYYALVAKGWDYLSNSTFRAILISLAILGSLVAVYPFYFKWDQVGKGSFRAGAMYVRQNFQEGDIIYHASGQSALPFAYYFKWQVDQISLADSNPAPNPVNSHRLWMIVRQEQGGFSFALTGLLTSQSDVQTQSLCNSYIKNRQFELVDSKVFPGKNNLVVCLYHNNSTKVK